MEGSSLTCLRQLSEERREDKREQRREEEGRKRKGALLCPKQQIFQLIVPQRVPRRGCRRQSALFTARLKEQRRKREGAGGEPLPLGNDPLFGPRLDRT